MRKTLFCIVFLVVCFGISAQDKKITISSVVASSAQSGNEAKLAIDGDINTIWHSTWGSPTKFPVSFTITLSEISHVDYVRYIPRQDGNSNGHWDEVSVAYCPTINGEDYIVVGDYILNGARTAYDFFMTEHGVECGKIRFTIQSGANSFASASEIEAYAIDNSKQETFAKYFSDNLFTELKPEVTSSDGIEDADVKVLVDNLLSDAADYKKFRVGKYEAYMTTSTLRDKLKISSLYNNYENPTGVYLKAGESCYVVIDGMGDYPVGLRIKNWYLNESSSDYSLRKGLNYITATTEGNVFVNYYTDEFEQAPDVEVHFINAPVQGYWDQETMNNKDWIELLKGRSKNDNTILITRSEHAQLAYPVSAWLNYCPTNVDSTMTLYQQVQWAERDILGLERYGRQVKNRQLFYATNYGFMAAGGEGAYCHYNSLGAIMRPDASNFDFWGVGHEWGHNNQVTPGFKWSGCGETTNNIYAAWAQLHFTGKPHSLRLEDEYCGVNEYSGMRGGRMQTYFEEAVRKGIAWQLHDGPDYHGATSNTVTVMGKDADGNDIGSVVTTSRNYDHFVKLVPFWQLNLWGTLAGKCPNIIPMVIEAIRTTPSYGSIYNTNGKQQINWMKLACDSAKIDLLPFFEKAGMLRPIHAYIEDYGAGWNIITEDMISELKTHVKEQGYPAFTEEINYINAHNSYVYRDNLKLQTPEKIGEGCKADGNKVIIQHNVVRNAVAFETYNILGDIIRITMYGLGSDDAHSFTQVLYPKGTCQNDAAAYIMAVGYDGTRVKIYEKAGEPITGIYTCSITKEYLNYRLDARYTVKVGGGNGALSYGVIDRDSKLLMSSMNPSFEVPADIFDKLLAEEAYVSVFAAVGDPVKVKLSSSISDVQLSVLRNLLSIVKPYTDRIDSTGTKVGYFIPDSVAEFYELIHVIDDVVANKDTINYTYKDCYFLLDSAVHDLLDDVDARVKVSAHGYYSVCVSNNTIYSMAYDDSGLRANALDPLTEFSNQWQLFPSADEGYYHIQNRATKNFITYAGKNARVKAESSDVSQAIPFRLVPGEPGKFLIQRADDTNVNLYVEDRKIMSGNEISEEVNKNAWWILTMVDNTVKLPEVASDGKLVVYHIQSVENQGYLYKYNSGRNAGRVATGLLESVEDTNYWFYFVKGSKEGKYQIYNYATGKSVSLSNDYLYVTKDVDLPTEYSVSIANDCEGLLISSDEGNWIVAGSYLRTNITTGSLFLLHRISEVTAIDDIVPNQDDVDNVYYDLQGRVVSNPTSGIYIYKGQKVVVK